MSQIQGPWSFVYYQPIEGKLWFGRDYFGRRSLVWHLPRDDNDVMAVSSVAQRSDDHSDKSLVGGCLGNHPGNIVVEDILHHF